MTKMLTILSVLLISCTTFAWTEDQSQVAIEPKKVTKATGCDGIRSLIASDLESLATDNLNIAENISGVMLFKNIAAREKTEDMQQRFISHVDEHADDYRRSELIATHLQLLAKKLNACN